MIIWRTLPTHFAIVLASGCEVLHSIGQFVYLNSEPLASWWQFVSSLLGSLALEEPL